MKMGDGRDGRLAATASGYSSLRVDTVWISLSFFAPEILRVDGSGLCSKRARAEVLWPAARCWRCWTGFGTWILISLNRLKERQAALRFFRPAGCAQHCTWLLWGAEGVAVGLFVSDAVLISPIPPAFRESGCPLS